MLTYSGVRDGKSSVSSKSKPLPLNLSLISADKAFQSTLYPSELKCVPSLLISFSHLPYGNRVRCTTPQCPSSGQRNR